MTNLLCILLSPNFTPRPRPPFRVPLRTLTRLFHFLSRPSPTPYHHQQPPDAVYFLMERHGLRHQRKKVGWKERRTENASSKTPGTQILRGKERRDTQHYHYLVGSLKNLYT